MVWVITGAVGSRVEASKTNPGWLAAVREKPPQIFVWNRVALDGMVNVYYDIDNYMQMKRSMDATTNRCFLGFNLRAKTFSKYLKRIPLGKNSFFRIVEDVCDSLGLRGCGARKNMTTHGLRATTVTLLLKAGHADFSVAMRTKHRDVRSLKSYQNLAGSVGKRQQEDVFGICPSKKATVRDFGVCKNDGNEHNFRGQERGGRDRNNACGGKENTRGGPTCDGDQRESHGHGLNLLSNLDGVSGGTFNVTLENHFYYR